MRADVGHRLTLQALGHEDGVHFAVVIAFQNFHAFEAMLVIKGEGCVVVDRDLQHHHERRHLAQPLADGIEQQGAKAVAAGVRMHVDGDDVAVFLTLVMKGDETGDGDARWARLVSGANDVAPGAG